METIIQMILPGLILPALLSATVWWLNQYKPILVWALPIIWLPSFVWITGWPSIIPAEANQWLYVLVLFSVLITLVLKTLSIRLIVSQTILLVLILIAIAWPVLQYQFSLMLVAELAAVSGTGFIVYRFAQKNYAATPSITMAICSGGMGFVIALGGSLLIGQLSGVLAGILTAFVIVELMSKFNKPAMNSLNLIPVLQLYFAILVIARIYAEIPAGPSALLLVAPAVGLIPESRYASGLSAASVVAALSWLMLTADSSGYY